MISKLTTSIVIVLLLASCTKQPIELSAEQELFQEQLMLQLLDAKAGSVINIPAGIYQFNRSLSLNVDGVTVRGAGMDKTILSFKNQISGAEGFLVTASDFTIEDLAIEDTKGDALKINEGKNIIIRRVRAQWTNGPDTKNGAYGIYPVQTQNTLIEGVVAIGASDAGIYIGQSKQVVVRNNRVEFNVAGIEIENTQDADVYDNIAQNNTGGILVFNMPNLKLEGKRTRVYNNKIYSNNTDNFAPKGGPVASVPAGSGIVINSNDDVEIFNNELFNNKTAHIIVSSVYLTNYAAEEAVSGFDPYPEGIYIHDNRYRGGGNSPDTLELKALKVLKFGLTGRFPNVVWDGFQKGGEKVLCIANEADTEVLNADAPNDFSNPQVGRDEYLCELPSLLFASSMFWCTNATVV